MRRGRFAHGDKGARGQDSTRARMKAAAERGGLSKAGGDFADQLDDRATVSAAVIGPIEPKRDRQTDDQHKDAAHLTRSQCRPQQTRCVVAG